MNPSREGPELDCQSYPIAPISARIVLPRRKRGLRPPTRFRSPRISAIRELPSNTEARMLCFVILYPRSIRYFGGILVPGVTLNGSNGKRLWHCGPGNAYRLGAGAYTFLVFLRKQSALSCNSPSVCHAFKKLTKNPS